MGGALCLFVAIYGKPNSFCNLFAVHPNSLYILFSVLTLSALFFFLPLFLCTFLFTDNHCLFFHLFFFFTSDPSLKIFIPSPSCMLPCLFIFSDLSPAPVEGQWSDWGPWSKCSVTCDTGTEQRQRRCSPSVHGWAECKGPHQESRECTNPSCSGNTN